jgi:hypothetical protein
MDIIEIGCRCVDWIHVDQDSNQWRACLIMVLSFLAPWKTGNFSERTCNVLNFQVEFCFVELVTDVNSRLHVTGYMLTSRDIRFRVRACKYCHSGKLWTWNLGKSIFFLLPIASKIEKKKTNKKKNLQDSVSKISRDFQSNYFIHNFKYRF